jgi:hypothetical protein
VKGLQEVIAVALLAVVMAVSVALGGRFTAAPKAPEQVQMRCFPEGTLGTKGFLGCPDGYEYEFKDI